MAQRLEDLHEVPLLSRQEEVVDEGEGERDDLRQLVAPQGATLVQDLQEKVRHLGSREPGLIECLGNPGSERATSLHARGVVRKHDLRIGAGSVGHGHEVSCSRRALGAGARVHEQESPTVEPVARIVPAGSSRT